MGSESFGGVAQEAEELVIVAIELKIKTVRRSLSKEQHRGLRELKLGLRIEKNLASFCAHQTPVIAIAAQPLLPRIAEVKAGINHAAHAF